MNDNKEHLDRLLKRAGLRATQPRRDVLNILMQAQSPLSESDISQRLGSAAPDKTTIYRTLMALTKKNIVHQAYIQQRQAYFEIAERCSAHQCHPHFTCVRCHRTECLNTTCWQPAALPVGYTAYRQQIRIEGVCAACGDQNRS